MSVAFVFVILCGLAALGYGIYAGREVLAASAGSARMQEISGAIQEGAQAYLNRQYTTIAVVGVVIGVILGGRIGYVLFYNTGYYLGNPLEALAVWHGGMSFHGGLLGVMAAILLFSRRRGFSPLALGDLIACAAPIGLFFGRIANFVNAELWGRSSQSPLRALATHADVMRAIERTDEVMGLFRSMSQPERAIVIVTHDPAVAARCDHTWRLRAGRLE